MCVCERAYQLYCVSLSSPPRIAVLTAGYKGLFHNCKNKVHVVVVVGFFFYNLLKFDIVNADVPF